MKHFVKVTRDAHCENTIDRPMFFQTEAFFDEPQEHDAPDLKNAVVMGSKTWNSIPKSFRPLKDRINIIMTRDIQKFRSTLSLQDQVDTNIRVYDDFDQMFQSLDSDPEVREIVVIGGAEVTKICLDEYVNSLKYIVYTRVCEVFGCDVFIEPLDTKIFKQLFISKTFCDNDVTYDI